ncbi:hypothetical protein QYZ88_015715 [Lachnospiraceae bacterium C1.1]|nr:hypothetical protein [Lachnospiraceae bacterium C1.1]
MINIVKIVGEKKENGYRTILFLCAVACFFLAFLQMEPALRTRNYILVPGYISDITVTNLSSSRGKKIKYEYLVHWFFEGQEYTKKQSSLIDRPDDSISEVWISRDNTDMLIYSSDNLLKQSIYLALGGIVLFIVWLIIYKRSEKVPYNDEVAAGIFLHSLFNAFLSGFAFLISIIMYKDSVKKENLNLIYLSKVLGSFCVLLTAFFIILAIAAKREENRF